MPPRPRQNRQAYSKVAKDWLQSQKLHRIRMGCRNICCSKEDQWGIRWGRQKRLEFFRRSEGYAGQQRRGKQQWTGYADADPTSTRHELTACAGSCQSSRMRRPFDGEHGLPLRIFFILMILTLYRSFHEFSHEFTFSYCSTCKSDYFFASISFPRNGIRCNCTGWVGESGIRC